MDNGFKLIDGKFCILAFRSRIGNECRALCYDVGYTTKYLIYNNQDIAELVGMSVIDFVKATPIIEGQKTKYYLE